MVRCAAILAPGTMAMSILASEARDAQTCNVVSRARRSHVLVDPERRPPAQQTPATRPAKTFTLSGEMLQGYQNVQRNLAEAAEKMPEEHYGFKPTPEIKPFGQLVAHVALLAVRHLLPLLKGEPNPRKDEKEEATRTKSRGDRAVQGVGRRTASRSSPRSPMPTMTELMKVGQDQVAKGLLPVSLVAHGMEMYGTMAVYLRLKGIVPPTTERQAQMKKSQ